MANARRILYGDSDAEARLAMRELVTPHEVDIARRAVLGSSTARDKARAARDALLRAKAYRAFREAGGNRANFERMWQTVLDETQDAQG